MADDSAVTLVRRLVLFVLVTAVSIVLDQVTKVLATQAFKGQAARIYLGDVFRFQYATNDGAFLSLGSQLPDGVRFFVLTVGVGLLLLGIAIYSLVAKDIDGTQVVGYALIVSGGASNWVDRARFGGSVVDFMNMGLGSLRTGVFNVADLAILAGIGVLLVQSYQVERAQKAKQRDAGKDSKSSSQPAPPTA